MTDDRRQADVRHRELQLGAPAGEVRSVVENVDVERRRLGVRAGTRGRRASCEEARLQAGVAQVEDQVRVSGHARDQAGSSWRRGGGASGAPAVPGAGRSGGGVPPPRWAASAATCTSLPTS